MFGLLLSAILGLSSQSVAQDNRQAFSLTDFSGGLNTWKSGIYLQDNESPNLRNVIFDKNGAISRRQGYSKRNSTAIGDGAHDVDSIYQLEQSNGNKYCVAFSSTTGYYSTDTCQTFTAFISTLTLNTGSNDVNCDAMQDRLYCVNNQYNFYFNGTDDVVVSSIPAGAKLIKVYRNRCFVFNTTANPSRVFYSALGDCTSWNTARDFFDIAPEDGDVGTGIGEPLYDGLTFYKKFSTWMLKGQTPDTFVLINISKNIGAQNHRAIANFNNVQYFGSLGPNGGQPGVYGFNGIVISEASLKLRNEIDTLDTSKANFGQKTFDSKLDWDSGTFDARALSSNRVSGVIESSYTSFTDQLAIDFNQGSTGTVSALISTNNLTFSISTFQFTNGNVSQGNYTNWDNFYSFGNLAVDWPTVSATGGTSPCNQTGGINVDLTSGYLQSRCVVVQSGAALTIIALDEHNNTMKSCSIPVCGGGGGVVFCNAGVPGNTCNLDPGCSLGSSSECTFSLALSTGAQFSKLGITTTGYPGLRSISTFTANNYAVHIKIIYDPSGCPGPTSGMEVRVTSCGDRDYVQSSTFTSRVFDLAISTPVFGLFSTTTTINQDVAVQFYTQVATSTDGVWDTRVAASDATKIPSSAKPFLRYQQVATHKITNGIYYATSTFITQTVNVSAASTGTWQSPEFFTSSNMTAWQLFSTVQTVTGAQASIAYAIKTSTFSGGTSAAAWVAMTPGSAITASTGAYVVVKATYTVGVATEAALTDVLTLNWQEGSQAKSASIKVFNNRLHYGAQPANGTMNAVMYVLDTQGAWSKWTGVQPRMLNVVNQNFIMAGSSTTGGGFIYKLYDTDSDNGNAINALWESKDFSMGAIHKIKAIDAIYPVAASGNTTLNLNVKADGGLSSSTYTFSTASSSSFSIKKKSTIPAMNGNTFRIGVNNNAVSAPWDVLGLIIYYRDLGLMQP